MNKGQVKVRIAILKMLDWVVFIAIIATGMYFILNSERSEIIGLGVLAGLLLVSKLGDYTKQKIARLTVDLEIEQKRHERNKYSH
jgi:hypothetical protein